MVVHLFKAAALSSLLIFSSCVEASDSTNPPLSPSPLPREELTPTQTILSANPSGRSVYSQSVSFVVKVVPTYVPGSLPSGTVEFYIDDELAGKQPLVHNIVAFTISSIPASPHSPHHLRAVYSGDSIYAGSRDLLDYFVLPVNTAVKLVSSINPSEWGEVVQFAVDVKALPPGLEIPKGSVQFQIEEKGVQTLPLDGKGHTSFSTAAIPVGEFVVAASFTGDKNYNHSSASLLQFVNQSTTKTTLASSENPSIFGKGAVVSATVSSSIREQIPSGEVQFLADGVPIGGRVPLNEKGEVQTTFPNLAGGNHLLTALYAGDGHFQPSSDLLIQQVNQGMTTCTLTSSKNPSVYGSKVTYTAAIAADHAIPSGEVKFMIDGVTVSKQVLDPTGNANYTGSILDAGKHNVTASYEENSNFKGSTARLIQTVDKSSAGAAITSSGNPSIYGSTLAFTLTVSSEGMQPKGSVQFLVDGKAAETKKLDSAGRASIQLVDLGAGEREITGSYLGNANFNPVSATLVQQIKKADTGINLNSSKNPSSYGKGVSISATVTSEGAKPRGSVKFLVDGTPLETKKLDSFGSTSLILNGLNAGDHLLTAHFLETPNFNPSSATLNQQIKKGDTELRLTSSENPGLQGSEMTFKTAVMSRSGKPAGSIEFRVDGTVIATNPLNERGETLFKISTLDPGKHEVRAAYLGSSNFSESSASLEQTVESPHVEKEK